MSFKRWHWIDDILLPLAVLGLRLCWLWPWLELLRRWITPHIQTPFLPLIAMIVLGAGGYVAARQALSGESVTSRTRTAVVGLGLAAVLVTLWLHHVSGVYAPWDGRGFALLADRAVDWSLGPPPAFVGLIVGVALWVQGVRDATPLSRHEQVWNTFTVGFVAFVLMLLLVQLDERGLPPGTGAAIWGFFGVGMAALALSALEYAGLGQEKGAAVPGMSRYWLGSMLAVVGAILGIGVLLAFVLTPGTVAAVFSNLRFLVDWLGYILGAILVLFAYLIFLIIEPLFNLLQQYMELPEPEEDTVDTQSLNEMMESFQAEPTSILPEAVADSLPWVALLLTAMALAIAVSIALRILRRPPDESFTETRESVFSVDLLQEQISSLWRRFSGREEEAGPNPFLSLTGEEERRREVRAIYQAFLARMQAIGHPRARQLTPVAYGHRLQDADAFGLGLPTIVDEPPPTELSKIEHPETENRVAETAPARDEPIRAEIGAEEKAAIDTLTAGYVQARYGDTAPTQAEVDAVQKAWVRLRAKFQIESPDADSTENESKGRAEPESDDSEVDDTEADDAGDAKRA